MFLFPSFFKKILLFQICVCFSLSLFFVSASYDLSRFSSFFIHILNSPLLSIYLYNALNCITQVSEQLSVHQSALRAKNKQLKALAGELNMYQGTYIRVYVHFHCYCHYYCSCYCRHSMEYHQCPHACVFNCNFFELLSIV